MAAAERALEDADSPDHTSLQQDILNEDDDGEPSPFIQPNPSRPTSVDGMHPAFANVLRATPSGDSLARNEHSPMRPFVFPRRARGGATFGAEARPTLLSRWPQLL